MVIKNNAKTAPTISQGSETESLVIPARMVSQTPGRIRFHVAHPHRQHHKMARITSALNKHLEVYRVGSNVKSGSITVHYAREHMSYHELLAILRDLDVVFGAITEGKWEVATDLTNAVVDLNQLVGRATNDVVDLRFLLPFGFSVLALKQLLVKGLQIESIPWYVLAWYAFDSFIKLHYTSEPQSQKDYQLSEY